MSDDGPHPLERFERMLRVLAALDAAGAAGVRQDRLPRIAGYAGQEDPRRMIAHDIADLNRAGWEILAVGSGTGMRYVLTAFGTRVPVRLDRMQEAALLRASRSAAGVVDPLAEPQAGSLAECVRAVGARALLSFGYRGRQRKVHPSAVEPGPAGWYLVGREDGGGHADKYFAVVRMRDVAVGTPGSAEVNPGARRGSVDPLGWLVDPPEEVRVRTAARLAGDVEQALGPSMRRELDGDDVVLTIAVTHQAAFRHRLYAFGGRVEVLAPERVLAGIRAELSQLAGTP